MSREALSNGDGGSATACALAGGGSGVRHVQRGAPRVPCARHTMSHTMELLPIVTAAARRRIASEKGSPGEKVARKKNSD